jgi:hypothetical protein
MFGVLCRVEVVANVLDIPPSTEPSPVLFPSREALEQLSEMSGKLLRRKEME